MSAVEVVKVEPESKTPATLLDLIQATIRNPDINPDTVAKFLAMQQAAEDRAAERAFNSAFLALQAELPVIVKDGKIDLGRGKPMPFASFENVMTVVKPKLRAHGFSESFTQEETPTGVLVTLTIRHQAGHSKTSTMRLPPDAGPGRNALQALGSASKYGWRYLILGMLAIVTVNEGDQDTDGAGATGPTITEQQYMDLVDLLEASKTTPAAMLANVQKRPWGADVKHLMEIPAARWGECVTALKSKIEQLRAKGK